MTRHIALAIIATVVFAHGAIAQSMIGGQAKQRNLGGAAVHANPVVPPLRGTVASPGLVKPITQRPVAPPIAPAPQPSTSPKKPRI